MALTAAATVTPSSGNAALVVVFTDASVEPTYITETGSASDTVTESGSQPDTITEGA